MLPVLPACICTRSNVVLEQAENSQQYLTWVDSLTWRGHLGSHPLTGYRGTFKICIAPNCPGWAESFAVCLLPKALGQAQHASAPDAQLMTCFKPIP